MVNVIAFQKRTSQEGKEYFAIQLQSSDIEFQISSTTGRPYATLRKCWMSSTFDEMTCKLLVGKEISGSIIKEECEPYSYVNEETGEEVIVNFRNTFVPIESEERKVVGAIV